MFTGPVDLTEPLASHPDEVLVPAIGTASGRQAFTELYRRFAARTYLWALQIVHDHAQAEEIAQETFVLVWRHASRYDPARASVTSWLAVVTRSLALDHLRRSAAAHRREQTHHRSTSDRILPDPVADIVVLNDEHRQVRAGLQSLTALQRQALTMAFYQGHTYTQISEILEVPLGTVKSRIRDALQRLSSQMATPAA